MLMNFESPMSSCEMGGARKALQPRLPKVINLAAFAVPANQGNRNRAPRLQVVRTTAKLSL
jgi:hypothetical protein